MIPSIFCLVLVANGRLTWLCEFISIIVDISYVPLCFLCLSNILHRTAKNGTRRNKTLCVAEGNRECLKFHIFRCCFASFCVGAVAVAATYSTRFLLVSLLRLYYRRWVEWSLNEFASKLKHDGSADDWKTVSKLVCRMKHSYVLYFHRLFFGLTSKVTLNGLMTF